MTSPHRRRPAPVERIVRGYAAYAVGRLAYGLLLIVLIPVVLILGIVVFGVLGVIAFGLITILGEPGPPLGTIISVGWFVGGLVLIFLILRWGHRWLARLLAIADAPAAWLEPAPDDEDGGQPAWLRDPAPDYRERLAAADARHASTESSEDPLTPTETEVLDEPREKP